MADAEYIRPWQIRLARKIRREIDTWKEAWQVLFPPKPKPKLDLAVLPHNVIELPSLADRIQQFVQQEEQTSGERLSCRQVAEAMNCSPSTVSRALRR